MVSIRSLAGETHDDVHKLILGYIGMSIIRLPEGVRRARRQIRRAAAVCRLGF
jgi:hypothetical protein